VPEIDREFVELARERQRRAPLRTLGRETVRRRCLHSDNAIQQFFQGLGKGE
jgi:hypothetical protein